MTEYITDSIQSPQIIGLTIAYLILASVTTFGIRITQAKKNGTWPVGEPDLPKWTGILFWLEWMVFILILILNWKFGIALFILKFILKVLPVLETIGNILMRPFRK